ncbi:MAG: UPF0182 family protein [Firmicutes bacterium]|nr:UPF0182 family protein [Bacillota bacterium]
MTPNVRSNTARRLAAFTLITGFLFFFFFLPWLYTDFLWFDSLGISALFWNYLGSQWAVALAAGLVLFIFVFLNYWLAIRSRPRMTVASVEFLPPILTPWGKMFTQRSLMLFGALGSAGLAFFGGVYGASTWLKFKLFFARVPFGSAEPLFQRDIGFYIFELPVLRIIQGYAGFLVVAALIVVAAVYLLTGGLVDASGRFRLSRQARVHLSILLSGYFLLKAWDYRLDALELVYSGGKFFGAGYADVRAFLPGLRILSVVIVLAAVVLPYVIVRGRSLRPVGMITGGILVLSILLGYVYPGVVQRFVVEPSELDRERPYLTNHIALTRQAYNLDQVTEKDFPVGDELNTEILKANAPTVENIRLWDYRPLGQSYKQLQELRQYYRFNDVDVDRYQINGRYRQVLLSARELDQTSLPSQAQTWLNQNFVYTHGYGLVMSTVNEVASEGQPSFLIKNIPPVAQADIVVQRPEIYYGELTDNPVFVRTTQKEFDYPVGDQNKYTLYEGAGGVPLDSPLKKLAFSLRLGSYRLILSDVLQPESRLLLYRKVTDRVRRLAPFLLLDRDPYLVVQDGSLFWIVDAYTTSSRFPYSQPADEGLNYIRNSVKVTVDAYSGEVSFYLIDESDPLIQAYSKAFPGLLKPIEEMPEGLRSHLRYPQDLFMIQARMFSVYHMADVQLFYNREDVWNIPSERFDEQVVKMEPYYIIMRIPGEELEEFILMLPFTPAAKDNMVTWLAARSDGEQYGKLILFKFGKDKIVYGPSQIEARIDQDTEISQRLTLWSQAGSRAIRGNLMVIPIGETILYVEPLYLQAEAGGLPELRRIIAVHGARVFMALSLEEALAGVIGPAGDPPAGGDDPLGPEGADGRPPDPRIPGGDSTGPLPNDPVELGRRARELLEQAQERARAGDWAGYGRSLSELEAVLARLTESTSR